MYYDTISGRCLNARGLALRNLHPEDRAALARAGVYPLRIEQPEHDPQTEGIEPDGRPVPDPDDPSTLVQSMRVFDLLEPARADKRTLATTRRWEHETGGITLPDGTRILTGIDDQNRISTAIQGMRESGMSEVDFKTASGWRRLTLDELTGIAGRIAGHVQACFSRERALHEAIDACASLDELNALDLDEGWDEGWDEGRPENAAEAEQPETEGGDAAEPAPGPADGAA